MDFCCGECGISWNISDESCCNCVYYKFQSEDIGFCKITGLTRHYTDTCEGIEEKRLNKCPECGAVYDDYMSINDYIKINEDSK